MQIIGAELLQTPAQAQSLELKLLANERAACIFPSTQQHSDTKAAGLDYQEHYQGNALAAMLLLTCEIERPNQATADTRFCAARMELRYHEKFSDARVLAIAESIRHQLKTHGVSALTLIYQGRVLKEWA